MIVFLPGAAEPVVAVEEILSLLHDTGVTLKLNNFTPEKMEDVLGRTYCRVSCQQRERRPERSHNIRIQRTGPGMRSLLGACYVDRSIVPRFATVADH